MLKFLRRYSQWILVIGGTLLMIAFLLPTTIQEIGKQPLFTTVMRIDGERIGAAEYDLAARQHAAMDFLTFRTLPRVSNVENTDHWLLLVREAKKGGYIAGRGEGTEYLPDLVRQALYATGQAFSTPPEQLEELTKSMVTVMEQGIPEVQGQFRLTQDEVYDAISQLHGIIRMQVAYQRAPRFSDRRLAIGLKKMQDRTEAEYIFVPPEQVIADVPEPSEEEIAAHFAKFQDAEMGSGDLGIGYRQPDRVKLEWLTLDRGAIGAAVRPDPVEVQKRFLRANPAGTAPEGQTLEQAKAQFESEVREELIERVMKAADQAIRGEFERATRRTQPDGLYRKLPEDWAQTRPDLIKVRDAVVARVKEQTGADIPGPTVNKRAADWLYQSDASTLTGIGRANLMRGSQRIPFSAAVFSVRELAGDNDLVLQVGVPGEALTDFAGNKYYYVIIDARKASAPESLEEVRAAVVMNLKKLAVFEKLSTQLEAYKQRSIEEGLDAIAMAEGSAVQPVKRATVIASGMFPTDPNVNDEAFRNAILKVGQRIDPGVNVAELPAAERTIAAAIPKSFGIAIARVVGVTPVTDETWRRSQNSAIANLVREELKIDDPSDNPFSFERLKERLKVERKGDTEDKSKDESKS